MCKRAWFVLAVIVLATPVFAQQPVTVIGVYNEDTPHVSGDKVTLAGCVQQTADGALASNGDRTAIQCNADGFLRIIGSVTIGTGGVVDVANITGTVSLPAGASTSALQPGFGTFGTPSANVSSIQGSSTMSPIEANLTDASGTPLTLAADATEGAAAATSGPQTMGMCDDTATIAVTEGQAGRVRIDCTNKQLYVRHLDPCSGGAKSSHVVNMSTATTVEIANAVASQFFYICSVNLVAAAAQTIAIGEDDTDGCGSITAGLHGGATAATGWSFSANGGIALGNGMGTVMKTATAARYLCIITGQAQQISGTITYVSAP